MAPKAAAGSWSSDSCTVSSRLKPLAGITCSRQRDQLLHGTDEYQTGAPTLLYIPRRQHLPAFTHHSSVAAPGPAVFLSLEEFVQERAAKNTVARSRLTDEISAAKSAPKRRLELCWGCSQWCVSHRSARVLNRSSEMQKADLISSIYFGSCSHDQIRRRRCTFVIRYQSPLFIQGSSLSYSEQAWFCL